MERTTMSSILYTKKAETLFNSNLLKDIQNKCNDEVLSKLQDTKPCTLIDSSGNTLLHFSAKYGNTDIMQYLLTLGANIDAENRMKETPLMWGVDAHQEAAVQLLLEVNADIFKPDVHGNCALKRALSSQWEIPPDAVQKIRKNITNAILEKVTSESLKNSKYVATKEFHVQCPLHYFIVFTNVEVTRTLLEIGSPVNEQNRTSGETPLHVAVKRSDLESIKLLLEYKARVDICDTRGKTPLASIQDFRDQSKTLVVVKELIDAGSEIIDIDRGLIQVESILQYGDEKMIETLLECSIDLQFRDNEGKTPFHYLAMNRNPYILKMSREYDESNTFEQLKNELLHIATCWCSFNSMKYLLDCGADVNFENRDNCSALCLIAQKVITLGIDFDDGMIVTEKVSNVPLHCIELLLKYGANPQIITEKNINHINFANASRLRDMTMHAIEPIFAHLALFRSSGQRINEQTYEFGKSCPELLNIVFENKLLLEETKEISILGPVSLFDFLIANDQQILLYSRNQKLMSNLTNAMKRLAFDFVYIGRILRQRFLKFAELVKWRESVINAIDEVLTEFSKIDINNVSEKIIDYLLNDEWKKIIG